MLKFFKKDPGKAATSKSAQQRKVDESADEKRKKRTAPTGATVKSPSPPVPNRNIRINNIRRLSSSTNTLNNNRVPIRKPTRPVTVYGNNITARRGQQPPKSDQDEHQPSSRASSVTNVNAGVSEPKNKGAKPKKSESRDRLDVEARKNPKKNNNELMVEEALKKQLSQMALEKSELEHQVDQQKRHISGLNEELVRLETAREEAALMQDSLKEENTTLRNRLRDVAHSPLSDNEKQQLLYESHRQHNSAPASMAANDDSTACSTPESSGNVSEVSVACLQDKISQMEETHYSTNEELQATLQELTDLQRQLTELQLENVRINEEKKLMFESLCRQTERLNDSRDEVDSLKQLLYKDENGQFESAAEREQKLVELIKSAQEERECLLVKQEQLGVDLDESRSANVVRADEIDRLGDRVKTLESTLDAKHAEHKLIDQELVLAKDQSSSRQIEINRLKDLLENARTKITELEQDRELIGDKSELDELLDNARKEKDALESEVAHLREQLALGKNMIEKLNEQLSVLQEECKVIRNNAKTTQSDLEYKVEKLQAERLAHLGELQHLRDFIGEVQAQAQCQSDEKRQLSTVLSETQRNLNESERKIVALETELTDVKTMKADQEEEWEKFQNDLLTSVRVANDFKTEAQQDVDKLILENKQGREKIKQLESQLEKIKGPNIDEDLVAMLDRKYSEIDPTVPEAELSEEQRAIKKLKHSYQANETLPLRPTTFQVDDLSQRRPKLPLSRQSSRQSVKSLIESIENAGKPSTKSISLSSRSSSTSSLNSLTSDARSPAGTPCDWSDTTVKTPLKEHQPNKMNREWGKSPVIGDALSKTDVKNKPEETYRESILQKSIEFSRRNSYSDLSERKDPLNGLVKNGGSKRNALLKWCQNKTVGYRNIDITNFSSSWNDGLALCALLHTYLAERIPYDTLTQPEKRRNFSYAFSAAESVGIVTTLNINDMIQLERPDWQQVMGYVTAIYKHFET